MKKSVILLLQIRSKSANFGLFLTNKCWFSGFQVSMCVLWGAFHKGMFSWLHIIICDSPL
jgi:hypothetical protein